MVFHRSLSDNKSPQVSRTLLSILAVLSNAVVWIVSTRPPTSKSTRPFYNPLVIVPKGPITIVTFLFHSFFNSLARSRYLFFYSYSFSFILLSFSYDFILIWYNIKLYPLLSICIWNSGVVTIPNPLLPRPLDPDYQ